MSEHREKGFFAARWTVRAAVELAIHVEGVAERLYRELARRWEHDPALQRLFTHVANEERDHAADLRKLLAGAGAPWRDAELDRRALGVIARTALSWAESGFLGGIELASSPTKVLEAVLGFERATALYYRGLRDVLGPSAILDATIAVEERHVAAVGGAIDASSARTPNATTGPGRPGGAA